MSACNREKELDSIELKFRPESNYWQKEAEDAHGITKYTAARFTDKAESFDKLRGFMRRFPGSLLICHALKMSGYFDNSLLLALFDQYDRKHEFYRCVRQTQSTITWLRYLNTVGMVQLGEFNLKYICNQWNIPLNHHDSKSDRIACQKIFYKIIEKVSSLEKQDNGLFNGVFSKN